MERNSSKDLLLQMLALADVCKIDILKDFAKFARKHFLWFTVTLLMILEKLEEGLRNFPPLGLHKRILAPLLSNSIDLHKTQNNKMKSWTVSTFSFL